MTDENELPSTKDGDERSGRIWRLVFSMLPPAVIAAVIAGFAQATINSAVIAKDYVTLAVEILQSPSGAPALRKWAVDVLDHYAEVELDSSLKDDLTRGVASIPNQTALLRELQKQIDDAEVGRRAATLGIRLPQGSQTELRALLERMSASKNPDEAKLAREMLQKLSP